MEKTNNQPVKYRPHAWVCTDCHSYSAVRKSDSNHGQLCPDTVDCELVHIDLK